MSKPYQTEPSGWQNGIFWALFGQKCDGVHLYIAFPSRFSMGMNGHRFGWRFVISAFFGLFLTFRFFQCNEVLLVSGFLAQIKNKKENQPKKRPKKAKMTKCQSHLGLFLPIEDLKLFRVGPCCKKSRFCPKRAKKCNFPFLRAPSGKVLAI